MSPVVGGSATVPVPLSRAAVTAAVHHACTIAGVPGHLVAALAAVVTQDVLAQAHRGIASADGRTFALVAVETVEAAHGDLEAALASGSGRALAAAARRTVTLLARITGRTDGRPAGG